MLLKPYGIKHKEYVRLPLNTPPENIRYENIKVVSAHIMDKNQTNI